MTLADQFFPSLLNEYLKSNSSSEHALLAALRDYTNQNTQFGHMLSGPVESAFLQLLIKIARPLNCLEVGTFTGYSALSIAMALPEEASLLCLETRQQYANIAQRFFNQSPHGKKINIKLGNAHHTIHEINEPLDFIFLDADKTAYPLYYRTLIPKLKSGGLFVADNTLWKGSVLTKLSKEAAAIDEFNQLVQNDPQVENVLLSVRDGIMLIRKL